MRIDLDALTAYKVDYDRYPYGQDNPQAEKKLYMDEAGKTFYIGPQSWLSDPSRNKCTFLTTEKLVADVIQRCFEAKKQEWYHYQPLLPLHLVDMPGVFPIKIPVFLDSRAGARKVEDLVREIRANDENGVIISNGVETEDNIYTFQGMKGLNGLETSNIYVVMNWFNPDQYAKLNILGQWLGNDQVLFDYYLDQLCQAVGRNSGFRDQGAQVFVTMSPSLWKKYLFRMNSVPTSRVRFYEVDKAPWMCGHGVQSTSSALAA